MHITNLSLKLSFDWAVMNRKLKTKGFSVMTPVAHLWHKVPETDVPGPSAKSVGGTIAFSSHISQGSACRRYALVTLTGCL